MGVSIPHQYDVRPAANRHPKTAHRPGLRRFRQPRPAPSRPWARPERLMPPRSRRPPRCGDMTN